MDGADGRRSPVPVMFVAFDLLELDGRSMVQLPIEERKTHLPRVVRDTTSVVCIRSYDDSPAGW